jgi:hypothetical protein
MTDEKKRIVINSEDLPPDPAAGQSAADAPTQAMQTQLPSIEGVRPQATTVAVGGGESLSFGGTLPNTVVAAVIAGLAGWGAFRIFFAHPVTTDLVGLAAREIAVFGAVFGAIFAAWEDARSGLWEGAARAAVTGLVLGAIGGAASGAVAQLIFEHLVKSIYENVQNFSELGDVYSSAKFYLARVLGWAIFGAGVGVSLGIAERSPRKAINGIVGGVLGGALGGLAFHYAAIHVEDEAMAQLIGFAVVGLGIGVAVGLVEVARRQAWLKVVRGGMLGKEFIVYHQVTNIGSASKCEITLIKDQQVAPFHCRIDDRGRRYSITAYEGSPVGINGTQVTSHWLRAGDTVEVGGTALQYRERQMAR